MASEISITLKGNGKFEDPWLVIRADTVKEAHESLAKIHKEDVFTAVGRAAAAYTTSLRAGRQLDATTIDVQETPKAEEKKAAPKKSAGQEAEEALVPQEEQAEPEPEPEAKPKRPKPAWAS